MIRVTFFFSAHDRPSHTEQWMIIIDNKKDTFFSDSGSISLWKTQEKTNGWYSMWLTWAKTGPSLRKVWPLWSNPRPDLAGRECLNRTSFTTSHPCTTSTLSSALLSLLTGIVTISILSGAFCSPRLFPIPTLCFLCYFDGITKIQEQRQESIFVSLGSQIITSSCLTQHSIQNGQNHIW